MDGEGEGGEERAGGAGTGIAAGAGGGGGVVRRPPRVFGFRKDQPIVGLSLDILTEGDLFQHKFIVQIHHMEKESIIMAFGQVMQEVPSCIHHTCSIP